MIKGSKIWLAVAAVALVQSAVLIQMVWARASLLQTGAELRLKVIPVDPRSLFRGDYVILGYDISRVPTRGFEDRIRRGQTVYVTVEKSAAGKWEVAGTSLHWPDKISEGQRVLRGKASYGARPSETGKLRVGYGIESYFIPEGTGRALEDKVRDGVIEALIAVGSDGEAAIKGLIVDGKMVSQQPLF